MKKTIFTAALALTVSCSSIPVLPAALQTPEVAAAASQQAVNQKADQIIATGKSLIGKATYSNTQYKPTAPYRFSCATFLMYIFEQNGVDLGTYNEDYMLKQGKAVARNQLQKGDLVFFKSKKTGTDPDHVGIYIGNNKLLHMADSKQNIVISDMNSKPYYKDNYFAARRVLPALMTSNPANTGEKIANNALLHKNSARIGTANVAAQKRFTAGGYVQYVLSQSGVKINTTTLSEQMKLGTTVARNNLRQGDIVFFSSAKGSKNPTLVGIYAGEHRLIIPTKDGVITRVLLADYYKDRYITAKRIIK
ncbi:NlpC/P60 family protein [Metasolibacillus meyeri]|uniref:NlpC/P60 family protein n=1 Tax=Metasolibacillus meyeri TaxID=1071052 RepID=A0AAW9NFW4_9BACL|nr:NlpC/P60 family protein [Metasolibacillus meyeri]MEC1177454.1 NlpC/P60 family protein [Metasolibacillus meyeri]